MDQVITQIMIWLGEKQISYNLGIDYILYLTLVCRVALMHSFVEGRDVIGEISCSSFATVSA